MAQTGSWVISQKWSLVEQNGQKFEPSGLYMYLTNAKYGQKVQTGSCVTETGSWAVSRKRSKMDQKLNPVGYNQACKCRIWAKMPNLISPSVTQMSAFICMFVYSLQATILE